MWKMSKMALVGAGIGGGFIDTSELNVMKFKEAMAGKDSDKWQKKVNWWQQLIVYRIFCLKREFWSHLD